MSTIDDVVLAVVPAQWASLHEVRRALPGRHRSRLCLAAPILRLVRAGAVEERGGAAGRRTSNTDGYLPEQYQVRLAQGGA